MFEAVVVLEIRREERTGWILKYPAVNSQRAPANADELDRRPRTVETAGKSVDVSLGCRREVNCDTGYTYVRLSSDAIAGLLSVDRTIGVR